VCQTRVGCPDAEFQPGESDPRNDAAHDTGQSLTQDEGLGS
jgi:hypothetical protein